MNDHGHEHSSHGHAHDHGHPINEKKVLYRLKICVVLNISLFLAGIIAWRLSSSIAVLGDSLENLIHGSVLVVSFLGISLAARAASPMRTYGFKRLNIYTPLFNAVALAIVGGALIYSGSLRIISPPDEILGIYMMIIPAIDIVQNAFQLFLLKGFHGSLTIRGILYHLAGDTLMSFGVIAGGAAVYFADFYQADGIAAILVGVLSLYWVYKIGKGLVPILLEWWPSKISREEVEKYILSHPEITSIHELHARHISVGPDLIDMNFHAVVNTSNLAHLDALLADIRVFLRDEFAIEHTAIQWELKRCTFKQEI